MLEPCRSDESSQTAPSSRGLSPTAVRPAEFMHQAQDLRGHLLLAQYPSDRRHVFRCANTAGYFQISLSPGAFFRFRREPTDE
jgi:hypothetical protein